MIKIKKIHLENFKCFKNQTFEFGQFTNISGENGSGKTTIADAISWVLFNKMSDGRTPEKIRPHDSDGQDIDYVDIVVELSLIVDGNDFIVKKTQSQIWTTPRGKSEAEYGGNKNSFEVNGVPMTEKNYKAKIEEIVNEEVFRFASNVSAFMQLDTKKRRSKLLEMAGGITSSDVVKENAELSGIEELLARYSYEEALAMTNKEIKEQKQKLHDIPIRIDELEKSKAEGDTEMLRIKATNLRAQIEGITANSKEAEIAKLEAEKMRMIAEVEKNFRAEKTKLENALYEAKDMHTSLKRKLDNKNDEADMLNRKKASTERELKELRDEYMRIQNQEWKGSTVCPTCGQKLPQESIQTAMQQFEDNNKRKLREMTSQGNKMHDSITEAINKISQIETEVVDLTIEVDKALIPLREAEKAIASLAKKPVDTTEIDTRLESLCKTTNDTENIAELKAALSETERQIARIEANADIDNRISALDSERRTLSQDIANSERIKFLLEEYSRKRVAMLTDEVNRNFEIVKWKLFENQINGGIAEVCNATVDGSILGGGLNTGHCVLAGFDICRTMQKVFGVNVPIIIDGAESLSEETLSRLKPDCQLILLTVNNNGLEVNNVN